MERIQLGRSPVWVSKGIFGAMAMGEARHDEARRIETIRAAIDAGMTTLDTAPLYDYGLCEEQVGRAIRGLRDRVQVFTKIGLRWDDPRGEVMFRFHDDSGRRHAVRRNCRPDSLRVEIDRSLKRLGVDVIDCVHVHQLDPATPIADTMGALKAFLQQGKIRAIGVSTNFQVEEVAEAQRALGDVPLASVQVHYSLLDRHYEDDLMPFAQENGIALLAHSAFEQGLLTGKRRAGQLDTGDFRSRKALFHPDNIARINQVLHTTLGPIALRHDANIAQIVLAWVRAQPTVSSVVIGASWPSQARANAQAMELELSGTELAMIRHAFETLRLDPNAGLSLAARLGENARRVTAGLRRRLVNTLGNELRAPLTRRLSR